MSKWQQEWIYHTWAAGLTVLGIKLKLAPVASGIQSPLSSPASPHSILSHTRSTQATRLHSSFSIAQLNLFSGSLTCCLHFLQHTWILGTVRTQLKCPEAFYGSHPFSFSLSPLPRSLSKHKHRRVHANTLCLYLGQSKITVCWLLHHLPPPPDAALGQAPCPCSLHICRNKNTDWGRKGGRKKEQRKEGGRWGEKKGDSKANGREGKEGGKMRKILREGELNDEHATWSVLATSFNAIVPLPADVWAEPETHRRAARGEGNPLLSSRLRTDWAPLSTRQLLQGSGQEVLCLWD